MKALITGASSGLGRSMAVVLSKMGYDIYAVARRENLLNELSKELDTTVYPLVYDLSVRKQCIELFDELKNEDIDIVINNAGFGVCGSFESTDLDSELDMIDTNITAVHIITKMFYKKFKSENKGKILNVSSSAGYMMGPFLSSYYASKAYVLRLSQAINRELKECGSAVKVSVLCPGPVRTGFDNTAGVRNSLKGLSADYVAEVAVKNLLKGKEVILPGISTKIPVAFSRFIPDRLLSKITYNIQKKKI